MGVFVALWNVTGFLKTPENVMVAQRESSRSLGAVLRTKLQAIQDFSQGNGKFDITLLHARWNYRSCFKHESEGIVTGMNDGLKLFERTS